MKVIFSRLMLVSVACAGLMVTGYGQSASQRGGDRDSSPASAPQTLPEHNASAQGGPVTQAIEMNVAEVELGNIAAQRAHDSRVKEFADMIVKDHTQALAKLRPLQGGSAGDVKANTKHKQTADRLSKLSGDEFDREYMNAMVAGHRDAVTFLEHQAGQSGKNAGSGSAPSANPGGQDLSKVAAELLPTTRRHLQMAEQIQKGLQSSPSKSDSKVKISDPDPRPNTAPRPNSNSDTNTNPK